VLTPKLGRATRLIVDRIWADRIWADRIWAEWIRDGDASSDFSEVESGLFRICPGEAPHSLVLSDGSYVARFDPILELHPRNEPARCLVPKRRDLAGAIESRKQIGFALAQLCAWIEAQEQQEHGQRKFRAVRADRVFGEAAAMPQAQRLARHFGFDTISHENRPLLYGLQLFANKLGTMISRQRERGTATEEAGLRHPRREGSCQEMWISRERLFRRFAAPVPAPKPAETVQARAKPRAPMIIPLRYPAGVAPADQPLPSRPRNPPSGP
jgi:hypothetical protein